MANNRKDVRVRHEGLGPELGQLMLTTDQVQSSADLRALLFERIVSTVAVQVKTRREQPVVHLLDGQPTGPREGGKSSVVGELADDSAEVEQDCAFSLVRTLITHLWARSQAAKSGL